MNAKISNAVGGVVAIAAAAFFVGLASHGGQGIEPAKAASAEPVKAPVVAPVVAPSKPAVTVSIAELVNDYAASQRTADEKYKDAEVTVTALSRTVLGSGYMTRMLLAGIGVDGHITGPIAEANFKSSASVAAHAIKFGSIVELRCIGNGYTAGPELKDCEIKKVDN